MWDVETALAQGLEAIPRASEHVTREEFHRELEAMWQCWRREVDSMKEEVESLEDEVERLEDELDSMQQRQLDRRLILALGFGALLLVLDRIPRS